MTTSQPPKDIILSTPTTPNISPVQEALGPIGIDTPLASTPYEVQVFPTDNYEGDDSSNTSGTTGGSTIKFGGSTPESSSPFKNPRYLKGCDRGIVQFLKRLIEDYQLDLTESQETSGIKELIKTVQGAWEFYELLVNHQVQIVVQGFRRSTLVGQNRNTAGLSGKQVTGAMGNLRNTSKGGAQSRTEEGDRWQAINTLGSSIARVVPIGINGTYGYYNSGVVISSELFNEVQLSINEIESPTWTLKDISSEEHKQVVQLIYKSLNDFFTNRFPRPFHCMTSSYFTTEGNEAWLQHPDRNTKNAGSYYMLCGNTDTTAALTTTVRTQGLTNLGGNLPSGGNNAYLITANSRMFSSFWKKDDKGESKVAEGAVLLMKAADGNYNRSITLPAGFLLGDQGAPNPVIQNLVDLLTGHANLLNEGKETPDENVLNGSELLGAIALKMMDKAGYPIKDCVNPKLLDESITKYDLKPLIFPFEELKECPASIIKDTKTVSAQEISLWAAWLVNMIVGVVGSNTQGAARGLQDSQLASQSVEDVGDEEADKFFASTIATTEAPSTPSVEIPPSALPPNS